MQLGRSQERRAHVDHLHQLALTLGVDIISSVQQPVRILESHHCYSLSLVLGKTQADCRVYVKYEWLLLCVVLGIE